MGHAFSYSLFKQHPPCIKVWIGKKASFDEEGGKLGWHQIAESDDWQINKQGCL